MVCSFCSSFIRCLLGRGRWTFLRPHSGTSYDEKYQRAQTHILFSPTHIHYCYVTHLINVFLLLMNKTLHAKKIFWNATYNMQANDLLSLQQNVLLLYLVLHMCVKIFFLGVRLFSSSQRNSSWHCMISLNQRGDEFTWKIETIMHTFFGLQLLLYYMNAVYIRCKRLSKFRQCFWN